MEDITMKTLVSRSAWICALTFGLGFGLSASATGYDPDCLDDYACYEIARDCYAQSSGGSTAHCARFFRECIAGCAV
jgi:hypothetical protein